MRLEKDIIGEVEIPENALYGIHSVRAKNNFPNKIPFPVEWFKAVGLVKKSYYNTYKKFKEAAISKYGSNSKLPDFFEDNIIDSLIISADEVSRGLYFNDFIVPGIQGGAGTSINMNVNEIIANTVLQRLSHNPGNYDIIHPIEHSNIFQSTNDVIPSSLKVAVLELLITLESEINKMRLGLEILEKKYRLEPRIGFTQMQYAVPSSFGLLFSAYNEAFSRDWWRVSKCFERIKTVNLGGSAIGTGITVPRYIIMNVVKVLQELSGLPVSPSENLHDTTSNLDSLVEIHAILKSHAVNIEKITSDIRLLASDNNADKILKIPKKQVGSSIMPGKNNPVIIEYAVSAAHQIYANDSVITSLAALGCLDLNAYLPIIGIKLIESINLLISVNRSLNQNLISGIEVDSSTAENKFLSNPTITTILIPIFGYNKSEILAKSMIENNCNIFEANEKLNLIDKIKLEEIIKIDNFLKLGYSLNDLMEQ